MNNVCNACDAIVCTNNDNPDHRLGIMVQEVRLLLLYSLHFNTLIMQLTIEHVHSGDLLNTLLIQLTI